MAPFIPLLVAAQPSLCSSRTILSLSLSLFLSLSLSLSFKRAHSAAVLFVSSVFLRCSRGSRSGNTGSDARPSSLFKTIDSRKQRHSQLFVLAGHLAASGEENDWTRWTFSLAASTIIFTAELLRIIQPLARFGASSLLPETLCLAGDDFRVRSRLRFLPREIISTRFKSTIYNLADVAVTSSRIKGEQRWARACNQFPADFRESKVIWSWREILEENVRALRERSARAGRVFGLDRRGFFRRYLAGLRFRPRNPFRCGSFLVVASSFLPAARARVKSHEIL